jgi:predicted flap endonuclease-1-like 5' DNA nuclease
VAAVTGSRDARPPLAAEADERERQRALRAERLARLRPAPGAGSAAPERPPAEADAAQDALEHFLRALTGAAGLAPAPAPGLAPAPEPAAVLPFPRPEPAAPASDLDRLPGAGPGLIWALERAGVRCLADLAPLQPAELAARLGPIGRLVPAARWIEAARAVR